MSPTLVLLIICLGAVIASVVGSYFWHASNSGQITNDPTRYTAQEQEDRRK